MEHHLLIETTSNILIGKARVKTQAAKIKQKINQDRKETLL